MTQASPQVQTRAKRTVADILSDDPDVFDPEDRVIDFMQSGMDSASRIRHLEVISTREFGYEEIIGKDGLANAGRSMEFEAFMETPVVIQISEAPDENASPVVFVGVNGDNLWLPRGVPLRIRRKHVERLAQSAERKYRTDRKQNTDGESINEQPPTSRNHQSYTFSVLKDEHPFGRRWLMRVTKQST